MDADQLQLLRQLLQQARAEAASIPDDLLVPLAVEMSAVSSWLFGEDEERRERYS